MPELPEVETIRREILPFLRGKVFTGLEIIDKRNIKGATPQELERKLRGKKILDVERRAKYLAFHLSPKGYLVIHLGMTGRLLFASDPYVKLIFLFKGNKKLFFSDARMFGKIRYFDGEPDLDLGPDPLTRDFTVGRFKELLKKKKATLKTLLMDQKFLSGVGNIYAAEILFRAGIHPQRKSGDLTEAEAQKLYESIREVLLEGIKYRGTSDSWYVDAKGEKGEFQKHLKVYGRKGEPCVKCKTPIQRIALGQRGTYFCPQCQK